jgi:hypothetical protein
MADEAFRNSSGTQPLYLRLATLKPLRENARAVARAAASTCSHHVLTGTLCQLCSGRKENGGAPWGLRHSLLERA